MTEDNDVQIAGPLTADDWARQKPAIGAPSEVWKGVFEDYFLQRLRLRYLDPVDLLQREGGYDGVGFSIMTILCSLVEFLESTARGVNYRFLRKGELLGTHEYNRSGHLFARFLSSRPPFSADFDAKAATLFYADVRCALLHEARTKNGWRIWAQSPDNRIAETRRRIVYRNNFRWAIDEYAAAYGRDLVTSPDLQSAFLRKFDHLAAVNAVS